MPSKLLLIAASLVILVAVGCRQAAQNPTTDDTRARPNAGVAVESGPVTVEIENASGKIERFTQPDVEAGTTLESLMRSLQGVDVSIRGSGTTAFVESIGGTKTSSGKGWTFTIDGKFVMKGIGQTELRPPAKVKWTFGEFSM